MSTDRYEAFVGPGTIDENGREHVRMNFLLTRHLRDYLLLFLFLEHPGEHVIRLG